MVIDSRVAPQSAQLTHRRTCRLRSCNVGELPSGRVYDRKRIAENVGIDGGAQNRLLIGHVGSRDRTDRPFGQQAQTSQCHGSP